ncbi:unnamed protein product [Brassica oleracea]
MAEAERYMGKNRKRENKGKWDELFICFSRRSICRMQQVIYNEIFKGNMTKKLDAYSLLKIDPTKVH